MALNSSKIKGSGNGGVDQPVIDPGVYPARIVQIIDLGLQAQRPFKGAEKKPANEIMFTYELVDSFMVDKDGKELEDKPRWVSETLPLYNVEYADKAKCTQRYKAVDPNNLFGGDFSKLVDIPINVALVHNVQGEKTYVNVASIAAMRAKDADKCPALQNPAKVFDLDAPDVELFNSLSDWIKEKIQKNLNYNGSPLQALLNGKPAPAKEEKPAEAAPQAPEGDDDKPWD
jgi:hypothetical protein